MTAETVAGLLDASAANRPDRPLLRDCAGATLTIAEVAALSAAGTRWLWDAGIRPGMTVAWQLPSHRSAALLMLALARSAVTQAPVLHIYRQREVCAALEVAKADTLVVDASTAANAPPGPPRRGGYASSRCRPISPSSCAPCPPGHIPNWTGPTRPTTSGGSTSPRAPPAARRACGTRMRPFWPQAADTPNTLALVSTRTRSARSPFPSRTSAGWSIWPVP